MVGKGDHKYCVRICLLICLFKALRRRAGRLGTLRASLYHLYECTLIKGFVIYHLNIPHLKGQGNHLKSRILF